LRAQHDIDPGGDSVALICRALASVGSPNPTQHNHQPSREVSQLLSRHGIDATAESVYLTILDNSTIDVVKLTHATELSEECVRKSLDQLVELELVTCDASSGTCTAIEPEIGLAALLAREQRELNRHQEQVEDTRLAVAHILAEYGRDKLRSPLGVEWIIGSSDVAAYVNKLVADCRQECLSLQPRSQPPSSTPHNACDFDELLARGVELRSIVLNSARNRRSTLAYLSRQVEAGVHIRTMPALPARIRIFDRRYAAVSVSSITGVEGILAIQCEALVHSFVTLFSKLWIEAEPFERGRMRRNGALSPQERHILKLWAQGHTDASAARQMDVSLRTVRRLSDRLTERFKARSRFQLGAAAVAQKLIDPSDTR
jgi:DNA-binding CsgD family transcriptional regulator